MYDNYIVVVRKDGFQTNAGPSLRKKPRSGEVKWWVITHCELTQRRSAKHVSFLRSPNANGHLLILKVRCQMCVPVQRQQVAKFGSPALT